MTVRTIRFNDKEDHLVKELIKTYHKDFSSIVKSLILEILSFVWFSTKSDNPIVLLVLIVIISGKIIVMIIKEVIKVPSIFFID